MNDAIFKDEKLDYWNEIYPDGMTAKDIFNELKDYETVLENVTLAYSHLTDNKFSKPNTDYTNIVSEVDYQTRMLIEQETKELKDTISKQEKVIETTKSFINKLDLVSPAVDNAFILCQVHNMPYTGENYEKELNALKSELSKLYENKG